MERWKIKGNKSGGDLISPLFSCAAKILSRRDGRESLGYKPWVLLQFAVDLLVVPSNEGNAQFRPSQQVQRQAIHFANRLNLRPLLHVLLRALSRLAASRLTPALPFTSICLTIPSQDSSKENKKRSASEPCCPTPTERCHIQALMAPSSRFTNAASSHMALLCPDEDGVCQDLDTRLI